MKTFIYAYKNTSSSARKLAELIGAKLVKHRGSHFKPTYEKLLINWGCTTIPLKILSHQPHILNWFGVDYAVNKLFTMLLLQGKKYCLPFTESKEQALQWIEGGSSVVCRTLLTGNSGNGIIIADTEDQVVDAPLYTKYIKKKEEYRVHVFDGEVIQVQRKAKRKDVDKEAVNFRIRNHKNGFIFQIHDFEAPKHVIENAIDAVKTLGLDFGAVDVAYNEAKDKSYVLEINTAPGLEGETLEKYAKAISSFIDKHE